MIRNIILLSVLMFTNISWCYDMLPLGDTGLDENQVTERNFYQELVCLSDNLYFEARGETRIGWEAIANVVRNRVAHKKYPNSYCAVVYQRNKINCQFSWVCSNKSQHPLFRSSEVYNQIMQFSEEFLLDASKQDITSGSLFYHSKKVVKQKLGVKHIKLVGMFGNHYFYKQI